MTVTVSPGSAAAASIVAPNATVTIGGGSLAVSDSATIGTLKLQLGELTGAGLVRVGSSLLWSGGSMTGSGSTVIDSAAVGSVAVTAGSGEVVLMQRSLRNEGVLNWTQGSIRMRDAAVLDNAAVMTAEPVNGLIFVGSSVGGSPAMFNSGTVTKAGGAGFTSIVVPVASTGTFDGPETSGLRFSSSTSFSGTATLKDNITFDSSLLGVVDGLDASQARLDLATGSSLQVNSALQLEALTLSGGSLTGAGDVEVTDRFAWRSGGVSGAGALTLAAGATGELAPALDTTPLTLFGRRFVNHGTLDWVRGYFRLRDGAILDNKGTLSAGTGAHALDASGNTGAATSFIQDGVLLKPAGTLRTAIRVPFFLAGRLDVQGPKGFELASPTSFQPTAVLKGDIAIQTTASFGVLDLSDASLVLSTGAVVTMDSPAGARVRDLSIGSGTLRAPAALVVTNSFGFYGGTLNGPGTIEVAQAATGTITGGTIVGAGLINRGTITVPSGSLLASGAEPSYLINQGTFVANAQSTSSALRYSGAPLPTFVNTGTLKKDAGTAETTIAWPVYQAGKVVEISGTIALPRLTGALMAAAAMRGPNNPATEHVQRCHAAKPVDCATGNQWEAQTDLAVGGGGLGLQMVRTYNSQSAAVATAAGSMGYGWTGSYSDRLTIDTTLRTASISHDNGSSILFAMVGEKFFAADYVHAKLEKNPNGTYTYTLPSQVQLTFAADGKLISKIDRNGNAVTLSYTSGKLTSATDAAGRALTFAYNVAGQIASVTDPAGLQVNYSYVAGNLTGVAYSGGSVRGSV